MADPLYMHVRLETVAGEYVTTVRLPRFVKSDPGVILWENRFFTRHAVTGGFAAYNGFRKLTGSLNNRIYREAFVVQAVEEVEIA